MELQVNPFSPHYKVLVYKDLKVLTLEIITTQETMVGRVLPKRARFVDTNNVETIYKNFAHEGHLKGQCREWHGGDGNPHIVSF